MNNWFVYAPFVLLLACNQHEHTTYSLDDLSEYREERLAQLNAPEGWLSLVGLYRLDTAVLLTLGSSEENTIKLPADLPAYLGTIFIDGDQVDFQSTERVKIEEEMVQSADLISTGRDAPPTLVHVDHHQFMILDRAGEFFLRLKDLERPKIHPLSEIPHFDDNAAWVFEAHLSDATKGDTFTVKNILGQNVHYVSQGQLQFVLDGVQHDLVAFGGSSSYFVMMSDETTSQETYGGGRYLYVPIVGDDGMTTLDFNRAQNPPCVFTDFATCPLPPVENHLPIRITAGEKVLAKPH